VNDVVFFNILPLNKFIILKILVMIFFFKSLLKIHNIEFFRHFGVLNNPARQAKNYQCLSFEVKKCELNAILNEKCILSQKESFLYFSGEFFFHRHYVTLDICCAFFLFSI
jgi:hypothetical protein